VKGTNVNARLHRVRVNRPPCGETSRSYRVGVTVGGFEGTTPVGRAHCPHNCGRHFRKSERPAAEADFRGGRFFRWPEVQLPAAEAGCSLLRQGFGGQARRVASLERAGRPAT
jgi:hypothetical protein